MEKILSLIEVKGYEYTFKGYIPTYNNQYTRFSTTLSYDTKYTDRILHIPVRFLIKLKDVFKNEIFFPSNITIPKSEKHTLSRKDILSFFETIEIYNTSIDVFKSKDALPALSTKKPSFVFNTKCV